ncbi:MAG: tRNA (adenosine(37)-N6)-threonylcarbamoyltransferase complex ATPase subunit type 1 TsaE [Fuerstiella sp.]|nr:tRNA (adenosine(37)-N6)-threonylcarbamoyltransferase complex ATPase subunit type 1 TsaE [Fuerstiella sp.]MCP4856588.1 tRNA (adenosine(37)-N6)-threonylcarbamoyltransferase complex ATPase subunit type 1 TsaE [Fuerstiella sp.]
MSDHRVHAGYSFDSHSEADTDVIGRRLAAALLPGITVALDGQLGSGKTCLVRSVCRGLGADDSQVNSPTFVLMQTYADGRLPVFHFDTYRLGDVDEFLAIGAEDYLLDPEIVCFVEWAERVEPVLPADRLTISIEQTGEHSRHFVFRASGNRSATLLRQLGSSE